MATPINTQGWDPDKQEWQLRHKQQYMKEQYTRLASVMYPSAPPSQAFDAEKKYKQSLAKDKLRRKKLLVLLP